MTNSQIPPKISIIVPVFNSEQFLRQCLNSLRNQTFVDFEVILVDDGSSDKSVEIIKEYTSKDARFSLIQQNHKFAGVARNTGMTVAKGEYLLFLDSDDFFDKDLLSTSYENAKTYDADISVFSAFRYDSKTTKQTKMTWVCDPKRYPKDNVFSKVDNLENLYAFTTAAPWTKLFKREFIERKRIRFQEVRSANDVVFVLTAIAEANRIFAQDKPLVFYRVNSGTSLQQTKDKDPLSFYYAVTGLKKQLINRNLYEQLQKPFLNYALSSCIFNLTTLKNRENFEFLYNKLKNEIFIELGFAKYDKNFYKTCGEGRYQNYQKILKLSCEDYIKSNALFKTATISSYNLKFSHCFGVKHLIKLLNFYKNYGLKNTVNRIIKKIFDK